MPTPTTAIPLQVTTTPDGQVQIVGQAAPIGANPYHQGYAGINFLHDLFLAQHPELRNVRFENRNDGWFRLTGQPDQQTAIMAALNAVLNDPVVARGYSPVTTASQEPDPAAMTADVRTLLAQALQNPAPYIAALQRVGIPIPTAQDVQAFLDGTYVPPLQQLAQYWSAFRAAGFPTTAQASQGGRYYQGPNGDLIPFDPASDPDLWRRQLIFYGQNPGLATAATGPGAGRTGTGAPATGAGRGGPLPPGKTGQPGGRYGPSTIPGAPPPPPQPPPPAPPPATGGGRTGTTGTGSGRTGVTGTGAGRGIVPDPRLDPGAGGGRPPDTTAAGTGRNSALLDAAANSPERFYW